MYESFYGFRDNPFRLTPDPDFLFLSATHQEALGHLIFGIKEGGGGVVVITGEIGAGKTTLLRTLVRNLDAQTTLAYIFNPVLSSLELLQTINSDLGLPSSSTSKKELTDELNRFLLMQQANGRRTVVIVDEAQDLEPGVLEQLRLLSNLETERDKLLQIVLVGQPELAKTLARPELAQLDQRVTLRWHLKPLPVDDVGGYIRHRLQVAGQGRSSVVFTPAAIRLVYQFSHGVPRLINVLCHRALLVAFTREERRIDTEIIRQAMQELRRHRQEAQPFLRWWDRPAAAVGIGLLLVAVVAALAIRQGWFSRGVQTTMQEPHEAGTSAEPNGAASAAETAPPAPTPTASSLPIVSSSSQPATPPTTDPNTSPVPHAASPPVVGVPSPHGEETRQEETDRVVVDEFLRDLQSMSMVDSAVRATDGLLQAWKVDKLREQEWHKGALDLNTIARARQLEYLPLTGSANLLSLLDLPMIMELVVPGIESARFVLLLGLTGDRCRIVLGHERELPVRVLHDNWFGKGYIFWKDFENVGAPLTVGSVGKNVKRLHTMLTKTQALTSLVAPVAGREHVFSRQTEAAIARFQRAKRLTPDGVAGPLTMILLYNSLSTYAHPSLGSRITEPVNETPVALEGATTHVPQEERAQQHEHNS